MGQLKNIKEKFSAARQLEAEAEADLKRALPAGTGITFHKGTMKGNHNARVLLVYGRRVKVHNEFTGVDRWIDLADIQGL